MASMEQQDGVTARTHGSEGSGKLPRGLKVPRDQAIAKSSDWHSSWGMRGL